MKENDDICSHLSSYILKIRRCFALTGKTFGEFEIAKDVNIMSSFQAL
jgi:hypothetical protein